MSDDGVKLSLITCHYLSARSHPDALHGLKKFPFSLNRRRDDDFGLLKLGQIFRADVTHAGGNRADKVLAAVIYFSRSEQNLFKRAGRADANPSAARQT